MCCPGRWPRSRFSSPCAPPLDTGSSSAKALPVTHPFYQLPATRLSQLLAQGEATSVEIVTSHLERIALMNRRLRAFTAVFRERALTDAARADEERRKGQVRGPLHGIPVSIKECIDLEGLPTTIGVAARAGTRASADGAIAKLLRSAGAIILGRTNLSQVMLFHESSNPLFGQTANPFSLAHTPGGSSGGEAAAIAAGMSPLGVGTDIGGSIRVPAHFTGIVGIKPTLDRLPMRGIVAGLPGQEAIRSQCGPMARTVADAWLLFRAMDPVAMSQLDPRVPPLPWEDPTHKRLEGLRVGTYVDDGVMSSSRAVRRAVDRAAEILAARGVTLVPFMPPECTRALASFFSAVSSDGGETVEATIGDGEVDPVLRSLRRPVALPDTVRRVGSHLLELIGEDRAGWMLKVLGGRSVAEFWRLTNEIRAYRFTMLEAMSTAKVDALLSPPFATPALPHQGAKNFALAGSYAMLWNLVQFPAGVVPVTRVRSDEARRTSPSDMMERHADQVDRASVGLPVGVQVIARPWEEATMAALMAAIEEGVSKDPDFPRTPVAD
ncbi:MAG: amidase [Deltaproteobacteria bacterium]|nr:amidase [Deltaproteobacteria bacterium]